MSVHTRHFARMVVHHHLATTAFQRLVLPSAFLSTRKYLSTKKPDLTEPEITFKDPSRFKSPLSTPELVVPPSLESLFPPDHTRTNAASSRTETTSEFPSSSDYSSSSTPPPPPPDSSDSSSSSHGGEEGASGTGPDGGQGSPKRKSRFWFYLYQVIFWSAIGSLPVHLLLTKGETKDTKIKQEWKIAVLQDMRDKLKRGESIEEEEAMLTIGLDRSKREVEQVDEKYFEELLRTAEKMDFVFTGDKDKDSKISPAASATPAASEPTPEPVVPRKPAPPKTERSYL